MKSYEIDYLQYSLDETVMHDYKLDPIIARKPSPMGFYTHCWTFSSGGSAHFGNPNTDKVLYVYGGSALAKLSDSLPTYTHIESVLSAGAKISRIDFAVTVTDDDDDYISVGDFVSLVESGGVTGSHIERGGAKAYRELVNQQYETVYIGSQKKRAKHGVLRVYNWSLAHTPDSGRAHTRIELEERRDKANTAAKRFLDGYPIGQLIQQRVQANCDKWVRIMGDASVVNTRYRDEAKQEETSVWHWLSRQVAPPLARAIVEDIYSNKGYSNYEAWNRLVSDKVESYIRELNNKGYID